MSTGKMPPVEPMESLKAVKHIITVGSGKGGVGKSTIAANLALALAQTGAKVALVDADIYGPSIPIMFDLMDVQPSGMEENGNTYLVPIEKYGLKMMSIGFFIEPKKAILWRGVLAANTLKQMFAQTLWGEIDYMVVDLPPGTGDVQISLAQMLKVSGALLVTTPQEVALADVRKAADMFEEIQTPMLGIVENMAYFVPAEFPDHTYYIFGKGKTEKLAQEFHIDILGKIPLIQAVAESGDAGTPIVLKEDNLSAQYYREVAEKVIEKLNDLPETPQAAEEKNACTQINNNKNNNNITVMDGLEKTQLVENVRKAIEQMRHYLQADGGDIAFIELTDDMIVKVRLHGACGSCPHSQMTLKQGVEANLKQMFPQIKAVENV